MIRPRRALTSAGALLALGVAFLGDSPAGAVDETKPVPCTGMFVTDPAADQTAPTGTPATALSDRTEILGVFFKHEPDKGAEAHTVNVIVKNLDLAVPTSYTQTTWNVVYTTPDETQRFVRAVLDFSGSLVFEYGDFVDLEATGSFVRMGTTPGKLFEGPEGVIQLVLPADRGGLAPGVKLNGVYSIAGVGRGLPNAATTPSRGLSTTLDSAPDGRDDPPKSHTITTCPATPAAVPPVGPVEPPNQPPNQPPSSPPPSQTTGDAALPVELVTKSVRAKKVKRRLALRLRSSEPISQLAGQVRRGSSTVARGSLSRLDGTATMRLRVSKRLRKGSYLLDLVGTDGSGNRRSATLRLRAR